MMAASSETAARRRDGPVMTLTTAAKVPITTLSVPNVEFTLKTEVTEQLKKIKRVPHACNMITS
jgi:hypothetical protein